MRVKTLLCAALIAATMPSVARADDPNDPTMRSAAARARDHAMIRQLNLNELARTRARDARYADGWAAYREAGSARYVPDGEYEQASAGYARDRAAYEHRMAEWRRAVAACRAGDYDACGG